jgi:hypothetical protein
LAGALITSIPFNGVPIPVSYTQLIKSPAPHFKVRFVLSSTSLSWKPDAKGGFSSQVTIAAADKDKRGVWKPRILRAFIVSLPGGLAPSAKTPASITFEMPYRNSGHLRFVVRDDASGRVGSSEIRVDPARIS